MRRVALPFGIPTGAGVLLGHSGGAAPEPALAAGAGAVAALWLSRRAARGPSPGTAARICGVALRGAAIVLAAWAAGALRAIPDGWDTIPGSGTHTVAGRIHSWRPLESGVSIRLEIHAVDGRRLSVPVVVGVWGEQSWGSTPRSSWCRFSGRLETPRGATNPGTPPYRADAARLRVSRGTGPAWGPGEPSFADRTRGRLAHHLDVTLGGFPARFAKAVLLGRSDLLTQEEREVFRRCGASHLVAVSGLHIGLAAVLAGLLAAPLGRRPRALVVTGAAAGYAALAGWAPSALRASVMVGAFLAGGEVGRPRPGHQGLFLAAAWLVWFDPELARRVGFQMSVGAVAGIFFALELVRLPPGRLRWIAGPAVVSLGAQWGTLAPALGAFGAVSPLGTAPNLAAVPLTSVFLPAVLATLLPGIGGVMAEAARGLARLVETVLTVCAGSLPYNELLPVPPVICQVIPGLLVAVWFTFPEGVRQRGRWRGAAAGLAAAAVVLVVAPWPPPPGPWIAFLDAGQADAAVIRLSDGTTWICDVGDDRGPGDAVSDAVLPFLRTARIRTVDGVILSHRHRDHVGALGYLIGRIPVGAVIETRGAEGAAWIDSLLDAHAVPHRGLLAGDTLHVGEGILLTAVHPATPGGTPEFAGDLNNASLVVYLRDGPLTALFAGDLEAEGEAACVNAGRVPRARVLKAGHHGSNTSSSVRFLAGVDAELAILSCGAGNRYGHPGSDALSRMRSAGVRIYRTDTMGCVWLRVGNDGEPAVTLHPPR